METYYMLNNKFPIAILIQSIILPIFCGCATSNIEQSDITAANWNKLEAKVYKKINNVSAFSKVGPYKNNIVEDYKLQLSPQNAVTTDLFIPTHNNIAPLIIMVHGNKFNKSVHKRQCERLSTWGFYCLTVEVPNKNQWIENGNTINKLVKLIRAYPKLISDKFDKEKIILIGHSFGGSAVTIATGKGAKVAGLILLDPAVVHPIVKKYMKKISCPVILLGADPDVFTSRKRKLFYKYISGPMSEVSVVGATHNDAQYPSINKVNWGFDFSTTSELQEVFLQSIIASSFSLASSSIDYAWRVFNPYLKNGILQNGRIRSARKE
ncbi:MAG: alpha/beta hydrolase [Bdellovibrionota bacterium]